MKEKINVSFSGGLSSAYMLWILLQNYDKSDLVITFANTGKEDSKTLDFVQAIAENWKLDIIWLEMIWKEKYIKGVTKIRDCIGFEKVDYKTASRTGKPFEALINVLGLPNRMFRFCTAYMKIEPINKYLESIGLESYKTAMGIRIDESKRARKFNKQDYIFPLIDFHITKNDVNQFWKNQPFTLDIPNEKGNCDLCFLKSITKRRRILRDNPNLGLWWSDQEKKTKSTFQQNLSVGQITKQALSKNSKTQIYQMSNQLSIGFDIQCFCGD